MVSWGFPEKVIPAERNRDFAKPLCRGQAKDRIMFPSQYEVELESIWKTLVRAADTGYSM